MVSIYHHKHIIFESFVDMDIYLVPSTGCRTRPKIGIFSESVLNGVSVYKMGTNKGNQQP